MAGLLNIPISGTTVSPFLQVAGQAGLTALSSLLGNDNNDSRIRLSPFNEAEVYGNGSGILAPLKNTNGMLFPYTPTISFNQSVNYADIALTHSNTDFMAYTRTPSVKISLNGKFTVQSQAEGLYALAAIHFLRTSSKMHFGQNDPKAGLPPPVLLLSGYGNYMFNKLKCILTGHSWTFDENVDTVDINVSASPLSSILNFGVGKLIGATGLGNVAGGLLGGLAGGAINSLLGIQGGSVKLPALFNISCELTVVQTPTKMRTEFNFNDFASGALMSATKGGWI